MRTADSVVTVMCRFSKNSGSLTLQEPSRPVQGLLLVSESIHTVHSSDKVRLHELRVFRSSVPGVSVPLGFDAASMGNRSPTFRDKVLPSFKSRNIGIWQHRIPQSTALI
jgi:hypothetical protein